MCARFTVLSDTPIAAAIAGCVIPLSRNSTIWMRWRCAAGIFHRSAVFSRRTSAWLHLTICFPPNQMAQANHSLGTKNNSPSSLCRLKSSIQAVIEVVLQEVATFVRQHLAELTPEHRDLPNIVFFPWIKRSIRDVKAGWNIGDYKPVSTALIYDREVFNAGVGR